MIDVIRDLFGTYTPISAGDSYQLDFEWLFEVILFMLVLSFIFRLIINLIKR